MNMPMVFNGISNGWYPPIVPEMPRIYHKYLRDMEMENIYGCKCFGSEECTHVEQNTTTEDSTTNDETVEEDTTENSEANNETTDESTNTETVQENGTTGDEDDPQQPTE